MPEEEVQSPSFRHENNMKRAFLGNNQIFSWFTDIMIAV